MEKRTCGLCGRRFSSGRALGGHMRSHMLFASPAAKPPFLPPGASPSSSSSSAAHGERNGPSSNPPKILQMPRPEFSFIVAVDAGSAVHDGDSEAEPSVLPYVCPSPGRASSSASDATTEEDVARCLMMLSRDIWPGSKPEHQIEVPAVGGGGPGRRRPREQPAVEGRSKYQCDTCKRVFKSYHALGGHRAGHKKMRTSCAPAAQIEGSKVGGGGVGIHECPFCDRIFSSAQALGGHKRSHLYPSASAAVKRQDTFIDLNLPAEDAELSSVSDAKLAFKWS